MADDKRYRMNMSLWAWVAMAGLVGIPLILEFLYRTVISPPEGKRYLLLPSLSIGAFFAILCSFMWWTLVWKGMLLVSAHQLGRRLGENHVDNTPGAIRWRFRSKWSSLYAGSIIFVIGGLAGLSFGGTMFERMLGGIVGVVGTLLPFVAVFFVRWWETYPKFFCGQCGRRIECISPWTCGFCGHENDGFRKYSFLNRCRDCGREPQAVSCPHCQRLILFGEIDDGRHAARIHNWSYEFLTFKQFWEGSEGTPSECCVPEKVPAVVSPEETARKKWAEEQEGYRIEMERNRLKAELEKSAAQLAKEKAGRRLHEAMVDPKVDKPKTEREKAAETVLRAK